MDFTNKDISLDKPDSIIKRRLGSSKFLKAVEHDKVKLGRK